jgi:hypothetical protein
MLTYNSGFQKQAVTIVEGLPFWQTLQLMFVVGVRCTYIEQAMGGDRRVKV